MFKRVGSLIKASPRHEKSEDAIVAIQVRQIAKGSIERTCRDLPLSVLKDIKVTTYRDGELTVVAPSIVCAELLMRSDELIDNVNSKVGAKVLRSVRFRAK